MTSTPPSPSGARATDESRRARPAVTGEKHRLPVTVVCVYNKPDVLQHCLVRSIQADVARAPETELIAVDNTTGQFPSAGAALNHGAMQARNDYIVFVHQDVYIHSLPALEEAAAVLADGEFGMLGAIGIRADGSLAGQIRDRVVISGGVTALPDDVDSLDEVLFMVPRGLLMVEPLSEAPALSWHAYAVEYGLRVRLGGRRVGAAYMPATHNSLTVNLDKLDVAHAAVAGMYPAMLPVRTTCGTIGARPRRKLPDLVEAQRWRYRWIRESIAIWPARRAAPGVPAVLADIRLDIDELLTRLGAPLTVVNLGSDEDPFVELTGDPLTLDRLDHAISAVSVRSQDAVRTVSALSGPVLMTNIPAKSVRTIVSSLKGRELRLGYQEDAGLWLAVGAAAQVVLPAWKSRRAQPWA